MRPAGRSAGDLADGGLVAAGAVLLGAMAVGWAGAFVAASLSGGHLAEGPSRALAALPRLAQDPGHPGSAWPRSSLPGPVLYWSSTAAVALVAVAVGWWAWHLISHPQTRRFGAKRDAVVASRTDVAALRVNSTLPPTGRLLLGRLAPRGPLLATETPAPGRRGRPSGDRGSVALIGPTRSGKSALAVGGLVGWDGPAVVLSVKRDVYDATASARSSRGDVAVFDPGGVTGLDTARWSPLRDVETTSGAARSARALAQAIPRHGVNGGDFWASHGETLIGAYMALAGLSRLLPNEAGETRAALTIEQLATWAYTHVGLKDPTVNDLVRRGLDSSLQLETRLLAKAAHVRLKAFESEDPRIKASIYATARLAFDAWTEPSVAFSATVAPRPTYDSSQTWDRAPRLIDLDWLMDGPSHRANTLYLTAPPTEFARLAPVLGGLLGDLREQIHAWDTAGHRLPKPLLILIDEAGQLELQWLPEEVSTIAGLGGIIVTCWQSRAQIAHRYGSLADAVLAGHRSKVFFSGIDDPTTLDYVTRVAGAEQVARRGWSADTGGGRRSISEQPHREDLLPAQVVRQMPRGDAVLIHGTLPPVHLRPIHWWRDARLRVLTGSAHADATAQTCPLEPPLVEAAGTNSGTKGGTG